MSVKISKDIIISGGLLFTNKIKVHFSKDGYTEKSLKKKYSILTIGLGVVERKDCGLVSTDRAIAALGELGYVGKDDIVEVLGEELTQDLSTLIAEKYEKILAAEVVK